MEFENLQIIWSAQDQQPLYAIDEAALHDRIRRHRDRSHHLASVNEIGLAGIFLIGCIILSLLGNFQPISLLPMAAMLFVSGYVLVRRRKRQEMASTFAPTLRGDLDNAIASEQHQIREARTFVFWTILPVGIASLAKMWLDGREHSPLIWAIVAGSFVLSYFVVRTAPRKHLRRLKSLHALRDKLLEQ